MASHWRMTTDAVKFNTCNRMMEKQKWERVGEEKIQVFKVANILVYNTWKKI
jgi:hypothetical protein